MTTTLNNIPIKLKMWLACIRYKDAIVAQVPALVGITFSLEKIDTITTINILYCGLGAFFLMAHIFCLNDWADEVVDAQDPRKRDNNFLAKNVTGLEMLYLAVVLGAASLLLFAILSYQLLILTFLGIVLSLLYSFPIPNFQGKRIPFLSSVLHIIGSLITFLLGYALFAEIDAGGLSIGIYFSLIFVAGHLMQEVQDWAGDRANGIRTHAVRFGPKATFAAANVIFSLSYVYLFWLAQVGYIPAFLRYIILFYPIYIMMAWQVSQKGLAFDSMNRFRDGYRLLYAVIVFIISVGVFTIN